MQPSGEAVPWVVQLTGLTGLEVTFGQWYACVGRGGSSDKAATHRRRHPASVVSHGFVAVDAYQRVEVGKVAGLFKCGDAPPRMNRNIASKSTHQLYHFRRSKETFPKPIHD